MMTPGHVRLLFTNNQVINDDSSSRVKWKSDVSLDCMCHLVTGGGGSAATYMKPLN